MREEEYLGRIKKLLSLIMPVGSVQALLGSGPPGPSTSANARAQVHVRRPSLDINYTQLSMLYNRFGAPRSRAVYIRAATLLALQALDMALPVVPALEWSAEIARVLLTEFRAVAGAGHLVGRTERPWRCFRKA